MDRVDALGRLAADSRAYQWMNVIGAAGFVVNSGYKGAMPSASLNVIWAGMGLFALWRIARRRAVQGDAPSR